MQQARRAPSTHLEQNSTFMFQQITEIQDDLEQNTIDQMLEDEKRHQAVVARFGLQ